MHALLFYLNLSVRILYLYIYGFFFISQARVFVMSLYIFTQLNIDRRQKKIAAFVYRNVPRNSILKNIYDERRESNIFKFSICVVCLRLYCASRAGTFKICVACRRRRPYDETRRACALLRARDYKQRFENNDIHMHFTHKMNLFTYIVYTNCATKISYFRIEKSLKLLYDLTRERAHENEPILIGAIEIYIFEWVK